MHWGCLHPAARAGLSSTKGGRAAPQGGLGQRRQRGLAACFALWQHAAVACLWLPPPELLPSQGAAGSNDAIAGCPREWRRTITTRRRAAGPQATSAVVRQRRVPTAAPMWPRVPTRFPGRKWRAPRAQGRLLAAALSGRQGQQPHCRPSLRSAASASRVSSPTRAGCAAAYPPSAGRELLGRLFCCCAYLRMVQSNT